MRRQLLKDNTRKCFILENKTRSFLFIKPHLPISHFSSIRQRSLLYLQICSKNVSSRLNLWEHEMWHVVFVISFSKLLSICKQKSPKIDFAKSLRRSCIVKWEPWRLDCCYLLLSSQLLIVIYFHLSISLILHNTNGTKSQYMVNLLTEIKYIWFSSFTLHVELCLTFCKYIYMQWFFKMKCWSLKQIYHFYNEVDLDILTFL